MALQIVLTIILERLKLNRIILSLLKNITFHNVIIIIKSAVNKNKNKYYYKKVRININPISNNFRWILVYYKRYVMIDLMFLKELILMKQLDQKSVMFFAMGIS